MSKRLSLNEKILRVQSGKKTTPIYNIIKEVKELYTDYCCTLDEPGIAFLAIEDAIYSWDSSITPDFDTFIRGYLAGAVRLAEKGETWESYKTVNLDYATNIPSETTPTLIDQITIPAGLLTPNEKTYFEMKLQGYTAAEIRRHLIFDNPKHVTTYNNIEASTIEKIRNYCRHNKIPNSPL